MMDVIVVGCGASGIAALRKLHDAGLKVLGLEAADRIGGRIRTVPFGEGLIDIGAAWCHGIKDNVVYDLVEPYDALGTPAPDNKWYVLSNGELVSNGVSEDILNALNNAVANADKHGTGSISESVRNTSSTDKNLTKDPQLTRSFVEWFERNNHVGGQVDPLTGKSLRGTEEFWVCEGEFMLHWKGKGYQTILDVLLNKYEDPSKEIPVQILLNKEVESIKWRSQNSTDHNPLVQVRCKDGSLYQSKSVVVTLSIGVLKERHRQLFSPALPAEKVTSIDTLQLAVLDKIYIEFKKPWWPRTPANFTLLWREEDKAKFSKDQKWVTEICGLQSVDCQPNVLLAWIYGEGAKQMEQASDAEVKTGVEKILDVLRKKFDVAPVKNILRSKWASNPLARGSYSYRSVATELRGGSAVTLSEPLYHGQFPVVCFAGEASSHHQHSAVHGAVEAGFREADRLIQSFTKL